jgi:hypothetical protein
MRFHLYIVAGLDFAEAQNLHNDKILPDPFSIDNSASRTSACLIQRAMPSFGSVNVPSRSNRRTCEPTMARWLKQEA